MKSKGFVTEFKDVWLLGGMRTPMVDYCGALGHVSPTDLGIKAARAALAKATRSQDTHARISPTGGGQGIALLLGSPQALSFRLKRDKLTAKRFLHIKRANSV